MFARIEVAMRPDFVDPSAQGLLRKLELAHPEVRKKVRWARLLDVYWLDLPCSRDELIPAIGEIFWDKVLQWLLSGNLIPSAAGKSGSIQDLMQTAPYRPGKFWGLERRYRPGVTDNIGKTALEAFEIVLGRKLPEGRVASGSLLLLEGPTLDEESLSLISREVLVNELIENWTLLNESEMSTSDRFNQERLKRDLPKIFLKSSDQVSAYRLTGIPDSDLEKMSQKNLWALNLAEMQVIRNHFSEPRQLDRRKNLGLPENPTDVEMEVLAQTWSEHCKHKIFAARVKYQDQSSDPEKRKDEKIPPEVNGLFRNTIAGTTSSLPKPWLLSVFEDNAGIVAFDDEDAFCIKVETHNSPSALDPYGGALTGIVGVNRDILGCGIGAKPIANTNVFCLARPDYSKPLPERLLHPRRILDGVRRGVEHGGNKSGIPTVNGALVFDDRFLGKPLIYCGTVGWMPRQLGGRRTEVKEIRSGDRICMVGGRIGKDGIHGATFSSLALDETSPTSAVQLGDPITQKRMADFLLEARDLGLYRALTDNGAGGLSSSVGEMARLSGGATMDVALAKTKYPGLKPFELVVSESQERMTVAVPSDKLALFIALADRRGVEVSDLGEFTDSGYFDVLYQGKIVASLNLDFLHAGTPKLEIQAVWKGRPALPQIDASGVNFESEAPKALVELLGRPNIASKEWLIRQYDHEVQGMSVIKPLHTVAVGSPLAQSGPNDGAVLKPKTHSTAGIAVACGLNPKLSDWDPYLMAQSSVDEAVRNLLCVGAEFGKPESVLALIDNFCWPDPVSDSEKAAALVRACYGMKEAALALSAPFISGKDSMKNDYRGRLNGDMIKISVPPTLLITAIGKVPEIQLARSSDFKSPGDHIYVLGGKRLGLVGSELHSWLQEAHGGSAKLPGSSRLAEPAWDEALKIYSWLGGGLGTHQNKLRSAHDISEGGLLVALAEAMIARGFGAQVQLPMDREPWEMGFGEGFHSFVVSVGENDGSLIEEEWTAQGVPFFKIGRVTFADQLEVRWGAVNQGRKWIVPLKQIRAAWKKEGYWE